LGDANTSLKASNDEGVQAVHKEGLRASHQANYQQVKQPKFKNHGSFINFLLFSALSSSIV